MRNAVWSPQRKPYTLKVRMLRLNASGSSFFAESAGPAQIEKKIRVRDVENLFLLIPIDRALVREFLGCELRHVETRACYA